MGASKVRASLSFILFLIHNAVLIVAKNSTTGEDCFDTINSLVLQDLVADQTTVRSYQLCSNTYYTMGMLDYDNQIQDGQEPIPLRPNMHLKCGSNGLKENNCIVQGGDVHVDGTSYLGVRDTDRLDNVTLEGITFVNSSMYTAWLSKPGSVTFKNCEFRDNRWTTSTVLLDYFDATDSTEELKVTFEDCLFDHNEYGGGSRQPALIVANSQQNRLVLQRNIFSNNNMVINNTAWNVDSFLIDASGPLTMNENCFEGNVVGVSPVVAYNTETFLSDNFGNSSNGGTCPFASRFETATQYETQSPSCISYDSDICYARGTLPPSLSPSSAPTQPPTMSPTTTPLDVPTSAPSMDVTSAPSSRTRQQASQSQDQTTSSGHQWGLQQHYWVLTALFLCFWAW